MNRTFAGLLFLLTLGQSTILAVPFTYCFVGEDLCCDGYSPDACCSTPDTPGFTSCCGGASILVARNAACVSQPRVPVFPLEASGAVVSAPPPALPIRPIPSGPITLPLPPHLASIVLLI